MKDYFYKLAESGFAKKHDDEICSFFLSGEDSDFCRFNHGKIRQIGSVQQAIMNVRLIKGNKQVNGSLGLSHAEEDDSQKVEHMVGQLRAQIDLVPDDPHLIYSHQDTSSEFHGEAARLPTHEMIETVCDKVHNYDFVGILSSGSMYSGFADSFGQRNWFDSNSFNLDWSIYAKDDRAKKDCYAGFIWSPDQFRQKIDDSADQLEVLAGEPRTIAPGKYRVFLAPSAVREIMEILGWGGFSVQQHETHYSPLTKMTQGKAVMAESIHIIENTSDGVAPNFNDEGFMRPATVDLIKQGKIENYLISPRSGKEYNRTPNGASDSEAPLSLEMKPGQLQNSDILKQLDTGLFIGDLHYLNFSDRVEGAITGMTRFATFWVENGQIASPIKVMRFDESLFNILGDKLLAITKDREYFFSNSTYFERARGSCHVPGILVDQFNFTL